MPTTYYSEKIYRCMWTFISLQIKIWNYQPKWECKIILRAPQNCLINSIHFHTLKGIMVVLRGLTLTIMLSRYIEIDLICGKLLVFNWSQFYIKQKINAYVHLLKLRRPFYIIHCYTWKLKNSTHTCVHECLNLNKLKVFFLPVVDFTCLLD